MTFGSPPPWYPRGVCWPHLGFCYIPIAKCGSRSLSAHFRGVSEEHEQSFIAPLRLIVIRDPRERIRSYWAEQLYERCSWEVFLKFLPSLMISQGDAHVAPFSSAAKLATHVRDLDAIDSWWGEFRSLVPALFASAPVRMGRAKVEKPTYTAEQRRYVEELYSEDLALWSTTVLSVLSV